MPGEGDAVTEKNGSGGGDLPASLEAAWGLRDRPAKGPKPGLSLERIVAAAVGVAASDGLAAVSMGRVAQSSARPRCPCTGTSPPRTSCTS